MFLICVSTAQETSLASLKPQVKSLPNCPVPAFLHFLASVKLQSSLTNFKQALFGSYHFLSLPFKMLTRGYSVQHGLPQAILLVCLFNGCI